MSRPDGFGGVSYHRRLVYTYVHLFVSRKVAIGPAVGEGAFSTVYIGKYFGDVVAVKKQTRQGRDLEKYLLRELSVLKYIRHQNMLEYIG